MPLTMPTSWRIYMKDNPVRLQMRHLPLNVDVFRADRPELSLTLPWSNDRDDDPRLASFLVFTTDSDDLLAMQVKTVPGPTTTERLRQQLSFHEEVEHTWARAYSEASYHMEEGAKALEALMKVFDLLGIEYLDGTKGLRAISVLMSLLLMFHDHHAYLKTDQAKANRIGRAIVDLTKIAPTLLGSDDVIWSDNFETISAIEAHYDPLYTKGD